MLRAAGIVGQPVRHRLDLRQDCRMSLWEMVLVAAGSAVAGALPVAWFARPIGRRPAERPEHPLAAVYPAILMAIGDARRAEREQEARRPAYIEFLVRVEAANAAAPSGAASLDERQAVSKALDVIALVGPADVVKAAQHLALTLLTHAGHERSPDNVERARTAFVNAARSALEPPASLIHAG